MVYTRLELTVCHLRQLATLFALLVRCGPTDAACATGTAEHGAELRLGLTGDPRYKGSWTAKRQTDVRLGDCLQLAFG